MLEHLLKQIDDDCILPQLADPEPAYFMPPEKSLHDIRVEKLRAYNVDLPFTPQDKRRIVENMFFNEALMAVKSSDRLAALNSLGKIDGINLFAAEKRTIEVKDISELREAIGNKLTALLADAVDGEIVE